LHGLDESDLPVTWVEVETGAEQVSHAYAPEQM
jgi:hypothetical protein